MKSPLIYKQHRTVQHTDSVIQPELNTQGMYLCYDIMYIHHVIAHTVVCLCHVA